MARSAIWPGVSSRRSASIVAPRRPRVPDRSRSIHSSPRTCAASPGPGHDAAALPAASAPLRVAPRRAPFRTDGAAAGAVVLDLDLLLADRVAHRLGAGLGLLAQPDLLD